MTQTSPTAMLHALAQHMASLGVAVYNPTGNYTGTPALPAIYFGPFPTSGPDRAVTINAYGSDPDYFTTNSTPERYVQIRWRGTKDPRVVQNDAWHAFEALHDTSGLWSGGIDVRSITRHIDGPLDADTNGRIIKPDSYTINLQPEG